jgi:putative endonuclease
MACVYILRSKVTDKFYVGSSREDNASVRLKAHNAGKSRSTKSGRPWFIVREEQYGIYTEARQREIFLKSGVGRKWIKDKIRN